MTNEKTSLETLLARLPRHRQLLLRDALKRHGVYEKDPIILLFLEVLENQDRAVLRGLEQERKTLKAIYNPTTFNAILKSRLVTWVVGPIVAGLILMTIILFARKGEIQALQKVVDEPQSVAVAMTQGAKAMREARGDIESVKATAILMNIPEAVFAVRGEELVIQFPKARATVSEDEEKVTIRLSDKSRELRNILENMGGKE